MPGQAHSHNFPEVGMFWAIATAHQRRGYATEAAAAVVAYGFDELRLRRMVATTEYDDAASIAVMRKLGLRIERNPGRAPFFLQVVGIVENPSSHADWPEQP